MWSFDALVKALCYQLLLLWDQIHHLSPSSHNLDSLYKRVEEQLHLKLKEQVVQPVSKKKAVRL